MPGLDGQTGTKYDEKNDVEQRENVIPGCEGAQMGRAEDPLEADDQLGQNAEEKQQSLIEKITWCYR